MMTGREQPVEPEESQPARPDGLRLRFFGGFEAHRGETPLPRTRTRKEPWLLALLTLRHRQAVDRSWLAGTLWPEATEERALAYLRASLYDLRRVLGPEASLLTSPTSRTVRLDLADANVDLLEFDRLIERGDAPSLEGAAALYRGPLLEGCTEEWVLLERAARHEGCLQALETLASERLAAGDAHSAARFLHRAIGLDPLRESAHRRLMEALARCGDYAAVDRQFRDLRRALLQEVNAEPSAETRSLYQRLRAESRVPIVHGEPPEPPRRRLPCPLAPLVGRRAAVSDLAALLRGTRLVSLTGTGGVGKTRLAIAVAEEVAPEFEDGVWFVDLSPLSEPGAIPQAVAQALGLREEPDRTLLETLCSFARGRRLLLVLDNCEHLVEGCAVLVRAILESAPGASILATSRQPLAAPGEVVREVPPLALPDPDPAGGDERVAVLLRSESAQLFVDRAGAASATFRLRAEHCAPIARLCRLLDGLPLALELAAAWVRRLAVEEIAARLGERLELPDAGRGRTPRHRSLHAALGWSYGQLAPRQARLLRRLAVFSGGWTMEAASVVGDDSVAAGETLADLGELVDRSLVVFRSEPDEGRYSLLETTRQYLLEKLGESGEAREIRLRHLHYFAELAGQAAVQVWTGRDDGSLRRLDREYDNARAALEWAAAAGETAGEAALASALRAFWMVRGHFSEGRERLSSALTRAGDDLPHLRVMLASGLALMALHQGDYPVVRALCEENLPLARARGNRAETMACLVLLSTEACNAGDYDRAFPLAEEALAVGQEGQEQWGLPFCVHALATALLARGDLGRAAALFEKGAALGREVGELVLAFNLHGMGAVAQRRGDLQHADQRYRECLSIFERLQNRLGIAHTLEGLGGVAQQRGDAERCVRLLGAAETLREAIGAPVEPPYRPFYLDVVAAASGALGELAFEAAWAEGRAMTLDEAVAFAKRAATPPRQPVPCCSEVGRAEASPSSSAPTASGPALP